MLGRENIARTSARDMPILLISEIPVAESRATPMRRSIDLPEDIPVARDDEEGPNEVPKQITYIGKLLCAHPKLCNSVREITIAHLATLARRASSRLTGATLLVVQNVQEDGLCLVYSDILHSENT